jgi:CRISPR type III-A-associated RAMP protein Csm5
MSIQITLKECIHSGLGVPYIPGSSIKGAIRTAIVATLAQITKCKYWLGNRLNAKAVEQDLLVKT